ncbi:MAG: hypothetical protein Q7W51_02875 [Coriobacteriia bacterium]|nr:hypothetical protein [Coriobacteriia bacterium]
MGRDVGRRTRAAAVLLVAIMILSGLSVVPAYGAAANYTPSYVESPTYILNDHTPFGVRFAAAAGSGLPEGTYYVKIRVANTNSRTTWDTSLHRGFTYDPVANHWEQERDDWFDCPTVSVSADGSIGNTWVYAKFGDETASGTRYIHVALSATGDGTTYNPTVVPQVTVLDTKTQGSWVHNGVDNDTLDGKRAAIRASDASTTNGDPSSGALSVLYALWEAQENVVDDDSNGIVNDENYGPTSTNLGDYRLSAPLSTLFDVYVHRVLRYDDFTTTVADADVALGATESVPPDAVDDLAVAVDGQSIDLTWTAATDDSGGSGVDGYRIYRWEVPTSVDPVPYTPVSQCIAMVDGAATSYSDTTFTNDVEYAYEVRVEDVATNISPRSNTVTVTAPAAPPVVLAPVYRFYNFTNNTHFFTSSAEEADMVIATWPNVFRYEGIAYGMNPANNTQPLYRFYNTVSKSHFYTASLDEANTIIATWPHIFTLDGQVYSVNPAPVPNSTPVYRFYNVTNGSHFYTSSAEEADMVIATWPNVYHFEGPAFWIGQ